MIFRIKFFKSTELQSVKLLAIGIALLYIIFVLIRLKNFNFIPSYFVCAGSYFCDSKIVPKNLVVPTEFGYDGQFYYRLSLNPFTNKRTEYGITIDAPPYRHQRILYPLVVWLLSCAGNYLLVPWMMILVNLVTVFVIIFLSIMYSKAENQTSPEWLILSLLPGFLLSLSRNTYENLASVFILGAFLFYKKEEIFLFIIFCILSAFTKETTIFIPVLGVIAYFLNKKKIHLIFFAPIILFLFWQLFLYFNWKSLSFSLGSGNFGVPFSGIKSYLLSIPSLNLYNKIGAIIIMLFIFTFIVTNLLNFSSGKNILVKFSFITYLFLMIMSTNKIWVGDNVLRVFPEFYISGWLLTLESKNKYRYILYVLCLLLWIMNLIRKINGL